MLEIVLGILGSGGFGSIVGLAGGYFNRRLDLEAKRLDLQDRVKDREHVLLKLDKEREYVKEEYAQKVRLATQETETEIVKTNGAVDVAGYNAMAVSYGFAAPTQEDGLVDKVSKLVRPILTVLFFLLSCYIFYRINAMVASLSTPLSAAEVYKVWKMIIEWVLFQAGVCIGWWFAMRPGRQAPKG